MRADTCSLVESVACLAESIPCQPASLVTGVLTMDLVPGMDCATVCFVCLPVSLLLVMNHDTQIGCPVETMRLLIYQLVLQTCTLYGSGALVGAGGLWLLLDPERGAILVIVQVWVNQPFFGGKVGI